MNITYEINSPLATADVIEVFTDSGIRRPVDEPERIARMFEHSNLIISAWEGSRLIGLARSLTDFSFCCYMSDLAVRKEYQKHGIGRELIRLTNAHIGDSVMLLLLSAPAAMEYYPKVGFEKVENGFIIYRRR